MRTSLLKFLASILFLYGLASAIYNTRDETWLTVWLSLFAFVAIPFFVLTWIGLGKALRNQENPSLFIKTTGILFGVPQTIFGLLSIAIGVTLIGWILYNLLIEQQEEFSGSIFSIGSSLTFIIFGVLWLRRAFKRNTKPVAKPNQNQ